jgi:phenylpropionate dioxygenase-like ring-hydroxylating dioxygenase large terminal subunit
MEVAVSAARQGVDIVNFQSKPERVDFNQITATVEDEDYSRLFPAERYISREWLQREYEELWSRVWQWACREEEIPHPGDYYEYRIGDQSVLIIRTNDGRINAFHNSCMHRGTRLAEGGTPVGGAGSFRTRTPVGGTGSMQNNKAHFKGKIQCVFHGWAWDLDGDIAHLPGAKDFAPECIQRDKIGLRKVLVDTWEGFVFINFDPNAGPLLDYLDPVPERLAKFEIGKMRILRHYTTILPCNWKYGVDQFQEGYHVWATHVMDMNEVGAVSTGPGGRRVGEMAKGPPPADIVGAMTTYSLHGRHTNFWEPDWELGTGLPKGVKLRDIAADPRAWIREAISTMVVQGRAAQYEVDYFDTLKELPLDMEGPHFMALNRRDACAAKGIDLSALTDEELYGFPCEHRIFPNMLGPVAGNTFGLFRSRPNGNDPDSCIWDMYFMFRYAEGEEVERDVLYIPDWRNPPPGRITPSFMQDWRTTPLFQAGMHQKSFPGHRFCRQEQNIIHTHKMLDQIIGKELTA